MSLKDDLKAIGLTDDQAGSAETVLRQYVAGEFVPKHRFDELNEKNKSLAQELGRMESEKDTLEKRAKKAEDGLAPLQEKLTKTEADWTQKYKDLEESYAQKEADRLFLEAYNAKMSAVKSYLGDSAYDSDMITSLIDFDTLEVADGKVTGVDKAIESLRKEKAFLFKDESMESTAPTSSAKMESGSFANFGETLAKRAMESDALTKAAADKYFK